MKTLYPLLAITYTDQKENRCLIKHQRTGAYRQNWDRPKPDRQNTKKQPATYCGFFTDIRTLFASVPRQDSGVQRRPFFLMKKRPLRCLWRRRHAGDWNEFLCRMCWCTVKSAMVKRYNRGKLWRYATSENRSWYCLDMTVDDAVEFFNAVTFYLPEN